MQTDPISAVWLRIERRVALQFAALLTHWTLILSAFNIHNKN